MPPEAERGNAPAAGRRGLLRLRTLVPLVAFAMVAAPPQSADAQVALVPETTTPAAWDRFTVRVVGSSSPAVAVEIDVPAAVTVLGIHPTPGWDATASAPTDSTPQSIVWSGGRVASGEFQEFAFLGRLQGDARRGTLVFPVRVVRADGSEFAQPFGVTIVGQTRLSPRGAIAVAGTALGLAIIAVIVAAAAHRGRQP